MGIPLYGVYAAGPIVGKKRSRNFRRVHHQWQLHWLHCTRHVKKVPKIGLFNYDVCPTLPGPAPADARSAAGNELDAAPAQPAPAATVDCLDKLIRRGRPNCAYGNLRYLQVRTHRPLSGSMGQSLGPGASCIMRMKPGPALGFKALELDRCPKLKPVRQDLPAQLLILDLERLLFRVKDVRILTASEIANCKPHLPTVPLEDS